MESYTLCDRLFVRPISARLTLFYSLFILLSLVGSPLRAANGGRVLVVRNALRPKESVSFAKITLPDGTTQMAHLDGTALIPKGMFPGEFSIERLGYKRYTNTLNFGHDTLEIFLFPKVTNPFQNKRHQVHTQDLKAESIIKNAILNAGKNDPLSTADFACDVYTKTIIGTDSMQQAKKLMNALLILFKRPELPLKTYPHHLLFMEAFSRKVYKGELSQKEVLEGINISGFEKFSALLPVNRFQNQTLYETYISLGVGDYISPLFRKALERYNFTLADTLNLETGDTLWAISFAPKQGKESDALKGFLYIDAKSFAVVASEIEPAIDNFQSQQLRQEYRLDPKLSIWRPFRQELSIYVPEALGRIPVSAQHKVWYSNFTSISNTNSGYQFDEIILDHAENLGEQDSTFWAMSRAERLQAEEKNTFTFYKGLGQIKSLDKILFFSESLYQGSLLPIGKLNLQLDKLLQFNLYETFRPGLGLLYKLGPKGKTHLSGYLGYGTGDRVFKYSAEAAHYFDNRNLHSLRAYHSFDYAEPGLPYYTLARDLYDSEKLRKFLVPRFDAVSKTFMHYQVPLFRNFIAEVSGGYLRVQPLYNYTFQQSQLEEGQSIFSNAEASLGFRWAFGEQFIRLLNEYISLGSSYPELFFTYTQGLGNYNYSRLDTKLQWAITSPDFGETGIQSQYSYLPGNLPFPFLFSPKASFQEAGPITYNSFETMRFNEFVANKAFTVFLTHKFNKLSISGYPFQPYFSVHHNAGWGYLENPEAHSGIIVRGFEKGFHESGLFTNDVFVVKAAGLKAGLGLGAFYRYGPYRFTENVGQNWVFKFAINVGV